MRAIKTHELSMLNMPLSATEQHWLYNSLDCCLTHEIFHVIEPQLDETTRATYEFSKALQASVLEMRLRGILVDQERRAEVIAEYEKQINFLSSNLDRIMIEGLGITGFNWRSPKQLLDLFYGVLGLPPIKKRNSKGIYAPTVDRDALEKLDVHFVAQPLISHILALRDIGKKIGVLRTEIDSDGRMRTSYNIAGTTTGRFSSSLGDFGTGTNLQNIESRLRSVFIADPGMKFAYIDLEQAESRLVGAIEWELFHDGRYLDACESGDLHTTVCRLAWKDQLQWTGDIKADRELADAPFYRQHSYRHMAKVLGHGTNYNGKPFTMAKHTKLDQKLIGLFQDRYFAAFPAHRQWHARVAQELWTNGYLTTITGRRRWFFGRRNDDATIREAIAFNPQGSVGDILNHGMLSTWRLGRVQLLLQIHDAILVQYPEAIESEIIPLLLKTIQHPIQLKHNRTLIIPSEAQCGWNWGKYDEQQNPDGLSKWSPTKPDARRRSRSPTTDLLDRIVR
jgi:DNA polymerase I